MHCITVETCCCRYPLKEGCYYIGIFCGARSILKIVLGALFAVFGFRNSEKTSSELTRKLSIAMAVMSVVVTVFSIAEIATNFLLVKATSQGKAKLLIPWMLTCGIDVAVSTFLFVIVIIPIAKGSSEYEFIWILVEAPVNVCLNAYFDIVVQSYYLQLKRLSRVAPDIQTPVPPSAESHKLHFSPTPTPLTQYLLQVPTLPPLIPPDTKVQTFEHGADLFGSTVSITYTVTYEVTVHPVIHRCST